MQISWNPQFQKALDAAGSAPARVSLSDAAGVHVLLPIDDYVWVRGAAGGVPDASIISDPLHRQYALLPLVDYGRIKPLFEEDPITMEERLSALREAGLRAGWNNPEWDIEEEMGSAAPGSVCNR